MELLTYALFKKQPTPVRATLELLKSNQNRYEPASNQ